MSLSDGAGKDRRSGTERRKPVEAKAEADRSSEITFTDDVEAKAEAGMIPGHMTPDGIFEYDDLKSGDSCPWCKTTLINIQAHQGAPLRVYCIDCNRFPNENERSIFPGPVPTDGDMSSRKK